MLNPITLGALERAVEVNRAIKPKRRRGEPRDVTRVGVTKPTPEARKAQRRKARKRGAR
jgi:hypothetical protein